jgi:SEC-C motif
MDGKQQMKTLDELLLENPYEPSPLKQKVQPIIRAGGEHLDLRGASSVIEQTGLYDRCWCGSGKKFKWCHRNRAREQPKQTSDFLPWGHRLNQLDICLHPSRVKPRANRLLVLIPFQEAAILFRLLATARSTNLPRPDQPQEFRNP